MSEDYDQFDQPATPAYGPYTFVEREAWTIGRMQADYLARRSKTITLASYEWLRKFMNYDDAS